MSFTKYILQKSVKKLKQTNPDVTYTHTRIGSEEHEIYGGSYHISEKDSNEFYEKYHKYVFVEKHDEYLTEKQLETNCPILVDFDLKYDSSVTKRQHCQSHITDMIEIYLQHLKKYLVFVEKSFPIYIFEKPNVNTISSNEYTKDGIHMIIGLQLEHKLQKQLRLDILNDNGNDSLKIQWSELPIINTYDLILDEGITAGTTNWQLFGSKKPNNEAYELTYYYEIQIDLTDDEFTYDSINDYKITPDFLSKISARNSNFTKFELRPELINKSSSNVQKLNVITDFDLNLQTMTDDNIVVEYLPYEQITNREILEGELNKLFSTLLPQELYIKDVHKYAMLLPKEYYEPGSHLNNRKAAFCLKKYSNKLFLSWVMLRSKSSDFDYNTIPKLNTEWTKYFNINEKKSINKQLIKYWAKEANYDKFNDIKNDSIDYYIEEALRTLSDYDHANILYHLVNDSYVCSSIAQKHIQLFKNHHWHLDKGNTLRKCISNDLFNIFQKKVKNISDQLLSIYDEQTNEHENVKKKLKQYISEANKFKQTVHKDHILKEAMELFYDDDFNDNLDTNQYLMCFSNGVIDFKEKLFRAGQPEDYISKTTGYPYVDMETQKINNSDIIEQIELFMCQLFPKVELREYVWDVLCSFLIGENVNQAFYILLGCGRNGKSKLLDLIGKAFGKYKDTGSLKLISGKRGEIGGTSSEIVKLKGIRCVVFSEPEANLSLNEGKLKELTGGEPIEGRGLYCTELETIELQADYVVCTNSLFTINSNDDGTWRRIKVIKFESQFVNQNEVNHKKHMYLMDKNLNEKIKLWAPVFMSMLVERVFKTNGMVTDCAFVKKTIESYRIQEDLITSFINRMIIKCEGNKLQHRELCEQFKLYCHTFNSNKKLPNGIELCEVMDKRFGKRSSGGWKNIQINYDDVNNEEEDEEYQVPEDEL
jgi:P4 family phage/plasmid primase-like protien